MIKSVANRAEGQAARQFKDLCDLHTLSGLFNQRVLDADVPVAVRGVLMHPRFRSRLERRALRRFGAFSNPSSVTDDDIFNLIAADDAAIEFMFADIGAYCNYAALRRIVDPSDAERVSLELGIDLTHHEARGLSESPTMNIAYQLPSVSKSIELSDLPSAILRDGAVCFGCWLEQRPLAAQRLVWALLAEKLREITPLPEKRSKREAERRAALVGARLAVLHEGPDDLQESA